MGKINIPITINNGPQNMSENNTPQNISGNHTPQNMSENQTPQNMTGDEDNVSEETPQEDEEQVRGATGGIDPDSPFYNVDIFIEKIQTMLTFDKIKKAELELKFAKERIEERDSMIEKGNTEHIEKIESAYELHIENVEKKINELEKQGKDVVNIKKKIEIINKKKVDDDITKQEVVLPEPVIEIEKPIAKIENKKEIKSKIESVPKKEVVVQAKKPVVKKPKIVVEEPTVVKEPIAPALVKEPETVIKEPTTPALVKEPETVVPTAPVVEEPEAPTPIEEPEKINYYCEWSWPQKIINLDTKEVLYTCPSSQPYCNKDAALDGKTKCCQRDTVNKIYHDCVDMS